MIVTDRFRLVPAAYVLLLRDGPHGTEVLLQLRAGTGFMDGFWASAAAGHVEDGESVHRAAVREAAEELGVVVDLADLEPLTTMHRTQATGLPVDERVDFFFTCRRWSGEPRAAEDEKSEGVAWFPLAALPDPVVPHERQVLAWLAADAPVPVVAAFGFDADGARPTLDR